MCRTLRCYKHIAERQIPRLPHGECSQQGSCSAAQTNSAFSEQEDLALDMLVMQLLKCQASMSCWPLECLACSHIHSARYTVLCPDLLLRLCKASQFMLEAASTTN